MSNTNRRVFLMQAAACGSVLVAARAEAQAAKLDEKDPQAVALGYVADTAKADTKKFPKHTKDQKCNNCALFSAHLARLPGIEQRVIGDGLALGLLVGQLGPRGTLVAQPLGLGLPSC
jgi:hypothetical protein